MKFYISLFLFAMALSIAFYYIKPPEETIPIVNQEIIIENKEKILIEYKNFLLGKFKPENNEDFDVISNKYTLSKNKIYIQKEAYNAFLKMRNEALKENIVLNIISGTRNFEAQKSIWNNKWQGVTKVNGKNLTEFMSNELERFKKILNYSSVPGTSRHHWGTDIDINNVEPNYFNTQIGKIEYEWLKNNADKFGFCQTYNLKGNGRLTGYNEEKWHWSYLPLARIFTQEYKNSIKNEDIKGFLGDKYVLEQDLINDYVLGINPECL